MSFSPKLIKIDNTKFYTYYRETTLYVAAVPDEQTDIFFIIAYNGIVNDNRYSDGSLIDSLDGITLSESVEFSLNYFLIRGPYVDNINNVLTTIINANYSIGDVISATGNDIFVLSDSTFTSFLNIVNNSARLLDNVTISKKLDTFKSEFESSDKSSPTDTYEYKRILLDLTKKSIVDTLTNLEQSSIQVKYPGIDPYIFDSMPALFFKSDDLFLGEIKNPMIEWSTEADGSTSYMVVNIKSIKDILRVADSSVSLLTTSNGESSQFIYPFIPDVKYNFLDFRRYAFIVDPSTQVPYVLYDLCSDISRFNKLMGDLAIETTKDLAEYIYFSEELYTNSNYDNLNNWVKEQQTKQPFFSPNISQASNILVSKDSKFFKNNEKTKYTNIDDYYSDINNNLSTIFYSKSDEFIPTNIDPFIPSSQSMASQDRELREFISNIQELKLYNSYWWDKIKIVKKVFL